MRGRVIYEHGLSAAMGRYYDLPSCSWVSTDSMLPDEQAALEKSIGFLTHIQRGVNLIWGVGQLESEMTVSPAQAVIDDEVIGYVDRLQRGIRVTPKSLAVDVTRDVGIGGSFLEQEHTLLHFRDELYEPGILCRTQRELWQQQGGRRLACVALEKANELIAAERPPCLPDDQSSALLKLEREFLRRL